MAPDRSKAGGNRNRLDKVTDDRANLRVHLEHHGIASQQGVVRIIGASSIGDLADVDTTTEAPADEQVLIWNGSHWVPGNPEVLIEVKNTSGVTINAGEAVYVSGSTGGASGKPLITKARSDSASTMPAIGLAQKDIPHDTEGYVVGSGTLNGLDTSAFAPGTALYIDPTTAGVLTSTRPTASTHLVQKVALVTRQHATAGQVIVMGAGRTNDIPNALGDVTALGLAASAERLLGNAQVIDGSLEEISLDATLEFDAIGVTLGIAGKSLGASQIADGAITDALLASGGQYHGAYNTEAETARSGATTTTEIYYTARPDGDGYAESEVSDVGETQTIQRRLYFSDKFDADPDTGADWTAYTTQPADDETFANSKTALLAGLSDTDGTANTRGTLPISLKMERTLVTPLLLDDYPSAAAAYSVRKLRTAYSGSAIRVREASGNTEADIGFDVSGELDTAAIASHCGSADGFVVTFYDQSGNGYNATQSTTGDQPQIYDGATTATLLENTKPALTFSGSQYLETSGGIGSASMDDESVLTVCAASSTSFEMTATVRYTASPTKVRIYQPHYRTTPDIVLSWQNTANYTYQSSLDTDQHLFTAWGGNPTSYAYMDGSGGTMTTQTGTDTSELTLGAFTGGAAFSWRGTIQEHVVWHSDQHANRTGIEGNVNTYFSIY